MAAKTILNPRTFPRPPLLEKISRRLQIKWGDGDEEMLIADTGEDGEESKAAYWVLETWHPPTYYIPRTAIPPSIQPFLKQSNRSSFCEWKGRATYWDITLPSAKEDNSKPLTITERIWSYEHPTPSFKDLKGYLSFYAGPWRCYVDGEEVKAQPGDFYGGWVTSDVVGDIKGGAGTLGW